ncbi:Arm DNA-binding domain-containing protein [Sulfitobacter sp. MF3-043]
MRDELMVGLMLRVSVSGRKVLYLTKRIGGRNTRIELGTYPMLSLADAREKARQILVSIENSSNRGSAFAHYRMKDIALSGIRGDFGYDV